MATIHDLLTRTDLMVRIENKEQANKLQDAGVKFNYYYYEQYYGLTYRFELLSIEEEQGRTLVPFDEIDFRVKEENRITLSRIRNRLIEEGSTKLERFI